MYNQLTREQRYGIYLGLQEGKSNEAIAQQIGVHASTVGRELKRNSGKPDATAGVSPMKRLLSAGNVFRVTVP